MKTTNEQCENTNKGITLIALIITIIVMLILVAVTITVAVNGGLFEYAGRAGAQTNEHVKNELEYANLAEGMTTDDLIDKYTGVVKITAKTIQENANTYYGKTINNYTLPEANTENITWRIFHSDGNNIYLIASDYVQNAPGITGTSYSKSFASVYR